MRQSRPSPDEERWLQVAAELGAAVPQTVIAERAGGWRSTGPLARIALFVLGLVAAGLVFGIIGVGNEVNLLIAGLIAALAAEWLAVTRRLFASGIEEGLCVAGFLLIGGWLTTVIVASPWEGHAAASLSTLVLVAAAGAAGLRRLNPLVTTGAVLGFIAWIGSTHSARALDQAIGSGVTTVLVGCLLATIALALGSREYRRPSHDRMLDWLVAALPIVVGTRFAEWRAYDVLQAAGGHGYGRLLTVVLLVAVGAAMLSTGLRRRKHAPLMGFIGCVVGLALELRQVFSLATETWLILYGLIALAAGLALDRYLRVPRNGFTASALTDREGPLDLLQTAGAAVLAQRAAPEAPRTEPPFSGEGGRFGGGGASGSY